MQLLVCVDQKSLPNIALANALLFEAPRKNKQTNKKNHWVIGCFSSTTKKDFRSRSDVLSLHKIL